ncbi:MULTISPECIES: hypothetical protein [Spirulina sp. CCY15215]|uniref:hypothetical protein n=1 Tax=Spirulina sp. CCY15215 TaxID=2767591 RepID=UPI00194E8A2B|nr:hypothetical protein [Spirulina major]
MSSIPSISCQIPQEWLEAIDRYASERDLNQSDVLKLAIASFLELDSSSIVPESDQLAALTKQLTLVSKQVKNLHKRLQTVEKKDEKDELVKSIAPAIVETVEAEFVSPEWDTPPSHPVNLENLAKSGLTLEELCDLKQLNLESVSTRAHRATLPVEAAMELATGWHYQPRTQRYYPPVGIGAR